MNGYIMPGTFRLFSELARNNDRAWFGANKQTPYRSTSFSEKATRAPDFLDQFARTCRRAIPLTELLTNAVRLRW
jgi:hypothetical protein